MKKAVLFDEFSYQCPFFISDTDINNGYGCSHTEQEEREEGKTIGSCFCHTCPLGIEAEEEDLTCPKELIDWDGLCEEGEVAESEYLLVDIGEAASEVQKEALYDYGTYMNRYEVQI